MICVDFRKLNEFTVGYIYPLPNIHYMLDKLGRARYFTAVDCANGYLQAPVVPEDCCKVLAHQAVIWNINECIWFKISTKYFSKNDE